jgi:hypothetical protein
MLSLFNRLVLEEEKKVHVNAGVHVNIHVN